MHLKKILEPIPQALLSLVFRLPSKSLVVNLSKNQSHMGPFTSIMFHLQGELFMYCLSECGLFICQWFDTPRF